MFLDRKRGYKGGRVADTRLPMTISAPRTGSQHLSVVERATAACILDAPAFIRTLSARQISTFVPTIVIYMRIHCFLRLLPTYIIF